LTLKIFSRRGAFASIEVSASSEPASANVKTETRGRDTGLARLTPAGTRRQAPRARDPVGSPTSRPNTLDRVAEELVVEAIAARVIAADIVRVLVAARAPLRRAARCSTVEGTRQEEDF
jgi:hypothetical protein